jgi:glycosyltransferase involved in cell wall biosynthesis
MAECLSTAHSVWLFWDDEEIIRKATERFSLDLSKIQLHHNIFSPKISSLRRITQTISFDCIFYISDGSFPFLLARRIVPIFQFPIPHLPARSLLNRLKLLPSPVVLCYSNFVKTFIDQSFSKPVQVLYPYVQKMPYMKKENIILSVGRFTRGKNTKKQEVLIDFFKTHKTQFKSWRLILAGAALVQDKDYVQKLKKAIGRAPIEIHENISFSLLSNFYGKAKIYWHAAGFGEDVVAHPEKAEHFGIATVEAMSAGCVPVVYNAGGQKEIVSDGENGFVWNDFTDLLGKTQVLMTNQLKWEKMSAEAKKRAGEFSKERFCAHVTRLL